MSSVTPLSPWTVVVTGPGGQEVSRTAMRTGIPVTIGRAPESTIMLGLMAVARHHGRIELQNGIPTCFNEPGAAGTLLDGDPVDGSCMLGERTTLEIGPYRFVLVRARASLQAAAPRAELAGWNEPPKAEGGTLLDRQLQGLRMYRSESQKEADARAGRWEQDWQALLAEFRAMQVRYGRHPRVLEFAVSKDEREVIVKLKEESRRGYAYFALSRQHPEGRYPEQRAVWLREVGRDDASFSEPLRGLEDLVSRIAPRLLA